ncbi:MAG TPA: hypothetical protein ENN49_01315 [Bacteroidales bacterium]|nr:hypothetical protein [Bacteroidales bacterium]
MIIIADSGATKTDWRILEISKPIASFETIGLSPYFNRQEDFLSALNQNYPKQINPEHVKEIFFYGSGCGVHERGQDVARYLGIFFSNAKIHAVSDALGAARALFKCQSGIVVILGTGSNIAYYDGERLTNRTPSLGFVLGDEGSGAYMGRLLLRTYLYKTLDADIAHRLEQQYNVELSHVLNMVYSAPRPSAYLASFVPFILENINNQHVYSIVKEAFVALYRYHFAVFENLTELPIGVTGSVGCLFSQVLDSVGEEHGFKISQYLRYPIVELINYHTQNTRSKF